jgi:ubiquinone/menaquinone biosynthesis C-methylase UbiE
MVDDAYGRIAKRYDTIFDSLNAGLRRVSLKMFPPTEGMLVLDVGCGTGSHLALYQQAGCMTYGIDLSPSMLRVAREKLGDEANLQLGDASNMPYPDDLFDLITTTLTLHEMPQDTRSNILNEMKRTLKPDGQILLIDFHPGSIRFPKGWLYKVIITIAEILAGREHFKNYRHFMAHGGLPVLIADQDLAIKSKKIVGGGNMALFLLQPET